MKSKIKKEYVLQYLLDKLNNTTQEVPFIMGLNGMLLYRPLMDENGNFSGEFEMTDPNTYTFERTDRVPVGIVVSNGDYSVIKSQDGTNTIDSSAFNATLSFLVYAEVVEVYQKLMFSMEEFRDKLLGNIDFLRGAEYDYAQDTAVVKYWTVATHCDDFVPGSELIVNGVRYVEFLLSIDLDVSEDLPYGNQFEWSVSNSVKMWIETTQDVFTFSQKEKIEVSQVSYSSPQPNLFPSSLDKETGTVMRVSYRPQAEEVYYAYYIVKYDYKEYERVIPLVVSWGSSQSLNGFQLLRNNLLTEEYLKKAQSVHNVASSRGWAITFTMLFKDTSDIVVEMFKETYPVKEYMNKPYKVKAVYKKKTMVDNIPQFVEYEPLGFEAEVIPQDNGTSSVHGDNLSFSLSMSLYWSE